MIYIVILVSLGLIAIAEHYYEFDDYANISVVVNKYKYIKRSIYFLIAVVLIAVAGFRYDTGFDYVNYVRIFKRTSHGERYLNVERAYYYINLYLHKLTNNYMWIFLLMALVTIGIKFFVIERINKKLKNTILFSAFIYFAMYFLVYDMGQIRSSFAQAMGLLTMLLYLSGYKKLSVIPILIGMTIHNSCAIVFLIYILGERRLKASRMIIIYVVFLIIGQLLNLHLLTGLVEMTHDKTLMHRFLEYTVDPTLSRKIGLSLNLIFQTFVLFIAIFVRWYYQIKDRHFDFMLNMYLTGASMYLLFNNYFVLGVRLSAYFNLAIVFILPKLVGMIKNKWLRMGVVLILTLILSVMVFRELHANADVFLPYRTVFGPVSEIN